MDRYAIRFKQRRVKGHRIMTSEIWRLSDNVRVHVEWSHPMGYGPAEAERIKRLLEMAPDDQAEAVLNAVSEEHQRAAVASLSRLFTKEINQFVEQSSSDTPRRKRKRKGDKGEPEPQ